jgi:hypothetical protein
MAVTTQAERRQAVTQTLASWRIEGFEPDVEYLALLDQYVAGQVTLAQVSARTDEAFRLRTQSAA